MPYRFYLTKIVNMGPQADHDGAIGFFPAIYLLQSSDVQIIDGRVDQNADAGWALAQTDNTDAEHAVLIADPRIIYIPLEDSNGNVLPPSAPVSEVANITAIKTFLEDHNIPTQGITGTNTIADALGAIVKRYQLRQMLGVDDFSELLDLQVRDVPAKKRRAINTRLIARGFDTSGITNTMTIRSALKQIMDQM